MNLTDFLSATDNKFASVVEDGVIAGDISGFVDSGSYTLNALLSGSIYGGFPNNKITIISSESGAGKCARGSQPIEVYTQIGDSFEFKKTLITYRKIADLIDSGRVLDSISGVKESDLNKYFVMIPGYGYTRIMGVIEKSMTRILRVEFDNGYVFEGADTHLFSFEGKEVFSKDVDYANTYFGSRTRAVSKEYVGFETVFDISIAEPHWYIAESETGVIHHNTFLSLGASKLFQERDESGIVIYFESESALSKQMIEERGLDTKRIGIVPVSTVQEFKTQCLKLIDVYEKTPEKERKPLFLVLDSLGMLSTTKEMEDSLAGNDTRDMTRASQIKSAFRTITLRLGRIGVPLLVNNHVYANLGGFSGPVSGGGCLIAGTEILMADGTVKPIDQIVVNDMVMTAYGQPGRVEETHYFKNKKLIELEFEDGVKIVCSEDHRFLINKNWANRWIKAKDLFRDDDCMTCNLKSIIEITRINLVNTQPVYDITVEKYHTYCLANGVICHNSGPVYSGSTCLSLTKAQEKNSDNEVVGAVVTITVTKGRLTREKSKVKCLIRHESGLDRYYGLLDLAEEIGAFKKVSTRYELPDGRKVFGKVINENPTEYYTDDILKKIDDYVGHKFKYGSGIPTEIIDEE